MDDLFERFAAVLFRVFDLARQFRGRFAFENHAHGRGRQMPFGMTGRHVRAGKVFVLVTILALHREEAFAIFTTLHILQMDVAIFSLQGLVAFRMTIHATRVHEHLVGGEKSSARLGFAGGRAFFRAGRGLRLLNLFFRLCRLTRLRE